MELMFSQKRFVELGDCDYSAHLRISSLLKYAQDIAAFHVKKMNFGPDKTFNKGLLWVVAKMHFEIDRMPHHEEGFIFSTWPNKCIHFIFPRNYEIKDEKGNVYIRGTSFWSLINKEKRSIVMPNELGEEFPYITTGSEIKMPVIIRSPEFDNKAKIKATWSNVDMNGHLNNTHYFDLVEDLIDKDYLLTHSPKTIDVTYKKEIKLGEEVELSYGHEGDTYYFYCDRFIIKIEYRQN